jgi:hypothetical protein
MALVLAHNEARHGAHGSTAARAVGSYCRVGDAPDGSVSAATIL